MKKVKVKLKDGTTVIGDEFDMGDYKKFQQIFRKWMNINIDLKQFGGRNLNVPDVLVKLCIVSFLMLLEQTAQHILMMQWIKLLVKEFK